MDGESQFGDELRSTMNRNMQMRLSLIVMGGRGGRKKCSRGKRGFSYMAECRIFNLCSPLFAIFRSHAVENVPRNESQQTFSAATPPPLT